MTIACPGHGADLSGKETNWKLVVWGVGGDGGWVGRGREDTYILGSFLCSGISFKCSLGGVLFLSGEKFFLFAVV